MKKNVLAVLLAGTMAVSLAACGSTSDNSVSGNSANQSASTTSPADISTESTNGSTSESTGVAASSSESVNVASSSGNTYEDLAAAGADAYAPKENNQGYVIGFSNFAITDSWRVQMEAEFQYHADQLKASGVLSDYVMTQANGDQSKQISDIEDLITMGVDAIVVTSITPDGLTDVLDEAREEGIKVINFNQGTNAEVDCKVMVKDYDLGYTSGQWLGERIPEDGKVIMLDGTAGNQINQDRHDGMTAGLKDACPNAEIIADLNLDWDYATAKSAMEDAISSYDRIDGILSQGGAMTLAAIDAYEEAGKELVPMTGEASNGFLKAWLDNADSGFESMAFSNPCWISSVALDVAVDVLDGQNLGSEVDLSTDPVTLDTAKVLYRSDLNDNFWVHTILPDDTLHELFPAS